MIYTVTLNPALDKTATVPGLTVDSVNRIRDLREDPGGKGINVSKVIAKLGGTSRAVALLGGSVGEKIKAMLAEQGIDVWAFEAMGETRTNLKVVDPELGTHTDINEPGPEAGVAQLDAMLSALVGAIAAGDVVVLSGSLPAGAPVGTYDAWCRACAGAGALVFLDADGEALARGLDACPFLAKPNDAELSRLCGHALETEAQVADEARRLVRGGVGRVVVSMGGEGDETKCAVTRDGDALTLAWDGGVSETLSYVSDKGSDESTFYSNRDIADMALAYYRAHNSSGDGDNLTSAAETNADGSVSVQVYTNLGDHNSTAEWYTIDRNTATGTDSSGNEIDLKS